MKKNLFFIACICCILLIVCSGCNGVSKEYNIDLSATYARVVSTDGDKLGLLVSDMGMKRTFKIEKGSYTYTPKAGDVVIYVFEYNRYSNPVDIVKTKSN